MNAIRKLSFALAAIAAIGAPAAFAEKSDAAAAEETVSMTSETLFSGVWTKKSFNSAGTWTIYQEGDKTYVKLSDDFRTRNAPDLKIFLSPLAAADTNGRNATDGSFLVAELKSNRGEQVYEISPNIDLSDFKSIVIHCQQFSKLWSAADLV